MSDRPLHIKCATIQVKYQGRHMCVNVESRDHSCSAFIFIQDAPNLEALLQDSGIEQVQSCQDFDDIHIAYFDDLTTFCFSTNGQPLLDRDGAPIVIEPNYLPQGFLLLAKNQKRALVIFFFADPRAGLAMFFEDTLVYEIEASSLKYSA
jgi:hypothetical protein